jgi:nitrate reductase gamma subunit
MSNYFFFIGLPYTAIVIMLVGTIFRYLNFGFKVSSLSSQFLEGRDLFYGSRPFHWGIIFLFFGHLAAFLFPKSVIVLTGIPMRLLILEVVALGFGLLALFGLVMLIIRRLTIKRVMAVTSKMDVFVYTILLTQVISGLWVAYFARWGSAWFPSVLTPYLQSLFIFDPEITAVAALPLSVKIHIISAFVLIGMIPFTRFMHFLVYPFTYFFRSPQYVIWNWDRKKIRTSGKLVNGVRSKNN